MKTNKPQFGAFLFLLLLFSSCALHYNLVQPQNSIFENDENEVKGNLTFECSKTDMVSAQSPALSRKLERNKLVFIPVKVTNNTTGHLCISDMGIEMINDYMPAKIVPTAVYSKVIRQKLWPNLLLVPAAIAASFKKNEVVIDNGSINISSSYRINLISGAISAWAILNTARTVFENKRAEKFFTNNDLMSMTIAPNSTVYALVCIEGIVLNEPMIRTKH